MDKKQKLIVCSVILKIITFELSAQTMTSPYSVYGIGDLDSRSYNRTSGMAGTGLAISSSYYLVDNNPAAIAGLHRSFYLVNIAATGKSVQYSGTPINAGNSNSKDFWIKRFGLAVKLNNHWASSIGMGQFSYVNYKFTGTKSSEGSSIPFTANYEGDGGLNEYYWNNAVALGKHFSIGLRSSIIAGSINQTETITDETVQSVISTKQQDYFGNLRLQAGAIYSGALNKEWDFSIGGRFAPKKRMIAERSMTVTENGTPIIRDEFVKTNRFYLPNIYAAGITFKHNKKTTLAIDYSFEDWSKLQIREQGWTLISSNRISAGAEFSRQQKLMNQLVEKRYFQFGAFFNTSHLQVRDEAIQDYGISAGTGGGFSGSLLYSLSAEVGRRGTTRANLVRENYIQFTIAITYRDYLFSKGRKYY